MLPEVRSVRRVLPVDEAAHYVFSLLRLIRSIWSSLVEHSYVQEHLKQVNGTWEDIIAPFPLFSVGETPKRRLKFLDGEIGKFGRSRRADNVEPEIRIS